MFDLTLWIRENVRMMKPYSCARTEFTGEASVFLDANENPYNTGLNRYPDPLQWKLKEKIADLKGIGAENIFLGNGSDEPIDLLIRVSCHPGVHNVVAIDPTYGMYLVAAETHGVEYRTVPLDEHFDFSAEPLLRKTDGQTRIVFLCSPNNPTGNVLNEQEIVKLLESFQGVVVLDEAYIDFSSGKGFLHRLHEFPNLVILQTFSKAWGMAGVRLGMAFASKDIIAALNKIKYPYNINVLTQQTALERLEEPTLHEEWVVSLVKERHRLKEKLAALPLVLQIHPSEANFLLIRVANPNPLYQYLVNRGIIVRNRNNVSLCSGCLRITVGLPAENDALIEALSAYLE